MNSTELPILTTAVDGVIRGLSDAAVVSQPLTRTSRQAEMADRNNMNPTLFMVTKITQSEIECQTGMGYIYELKVAEGIALSQNTMVPDDTPR